MALVGVVAGALLLSGCGAVDLPLAAVRLDGSGAPEALLRPCGDDLIQGLSLSGAPDGDDRNLSGWKVPGKRHGADAEFPLFSPPAAWHAEAVGKQRLVSSYTYVLAFGKAEYNYEYTGVVTFTAEDLARLRPGQVWADDRAMSLGEFERLAEDSC
ncbi:hypothetical protein [Streptomyces cylindrosporus]|uniref:Uncharacterized protein n=1 Tax=Streptomyces cylindrosporus TaxID=2927583 RepID=A0ABS9Y7W5_9ACTN|nr:hypothetical protein [Streptomyces cylindrosporus]MCI3273323.1 hypothetical protein [Streptomyces cylindrosporus]